MDFIQYANELLENLRDAGHLPPDDVYVEMDVVEPTSAIEPIPMDLDENLEITVTASQREVNVAELRDMSPERSISSQARSDQSETSANTTTIEVDENPSKRHFEPLYPELILPTFEIQEPSQQLAAKFLKTLKLATPINKMLDLAKSDNSPESLAITLNHFPRHQKYPKLDILSASLIKQSQPLILSYKTK